MAICTVSAKDLVASVVVPVKIKKGPAVLGRNTEAAETKWSEDLVLKAAENVK